MLCTWIGHKWTKWSEPKSENWHDIKTNCDAILETQTRKCNRCNLIEKKTLG